MTGFSYQVHELRDWLKSTEPVEPEGFWARVGAHASAKSLKVLLAAVLFAVSALMLYRSLQ